MSKTENENDWQLVLPKGKKMSANRKKTVRIKAKLMCHDSRP